jgi:hypothetical protein
MKMLFGIPNLTSDITVLVALVLICFASSPNGLVCAEIARNTTMTRTLVTIEQDCPVLSLNSISVISMPSSSEELLIDQPTCFQVPMSATDHGYRLIIRNNMYGRYEISERSGSGFAWDAPADGIFYCIGGSSIVHFSDAVPGSIITVELESVSDSEECFSDYISFNGNPPLEIPEQPGTSRKVFWSSHNYYLQADDFEYQVAGEEPVTLLGATDIDISGDPGWDDFTTVEITWKVNGMEKRLNMYLSATVSSWTIDEARVYDANQEWVDFVPTGVVNETLGECYKRENLIISNGNGSEIRFRSILFVPFIQQAWVDPLEVLSCVSMKIIRIILKLVVVMMVSVRRMTMMGGRLLALLQLDCVPYFGSCS